MAKRYRLIGPRPKPTNWGVLIISAVMAGLLAGVAVAMAKPYVPWDVRGASLSLEMNGQAP